MQISPLPKRLWIELALSALSAGACVLSLVEPRWIEDLLGFAPDAGSGEAEWGWSLVLLGLAVAFALLSRRDWRRHRLAAGVRNG